MRKKLLLLMTTGLLALTVVSAGCSSDTKKEARPAANKTVNVYSARHYDVDKKLYAKFEEKTGIKVNVIEGKAPEMLERLRREGKDSPADVFVTADMANLYQAVEGNMVQKIESKEIEKNIPANLRGKDNEWVAFTTRARIVVYDKEKVKPSDLSTYENLTADKWQGEILVRGSSSSYNQSLLASIVALSGEEKAQSWAKGMVENFARKPEGNDRDQVKAIAAGKGSLALVNTYYVAQMLNSKDDAEKAAANKVGVFFPKPTNVNISGAVLLKTSKNKDNALKLLAFLTDKEAQKEIADFNFEYPANPTVEPNKILVGWGKFDVQKIDLTDMGKYNKKAVEIFNKVGWK